MWDIVIQSILTDFWVSRICFGVERLDETRVRKLYEPDYELSCKGENRPRELERHGCIINLFGRAVF